MLCRTQLLAKRLGSASTLRRDPIAAPELLLRRNYLGTPDPAAIDSDGTLSCKYAAWIIGGSPFFTEFISGVGYDAIVIDLQHGVGELVPMLAAVTASSAQKQKQPLPIVRVTQNSDGEIYRALDAGARALICPMINSVRECEQFVRATKYPPGGHRSFGPHRAMLSWAGGSRGDFTRAANAEILTFAMIETRGAIDELDAILSVDGLSGVFIGPNDLGLALGHDPTDAPEGEVLEMIRLVLSRAHTHGKQAAIFCADPVAAKRMAHLGFDLVSTGVDVGWATAGAAAALTAAKAPP